jgi:hypothetical protein
VRFAGNSLLPPPQLSLPPAPPAPRFQPWPEASLTSVARKFLDEADLGDDAVRAAVVDFMPFSFSSVNKASKAFYEVERRHNYTTPKARPPPPCNLPPRCMRTAPSHPDGRRSQS